MHVWSLSADKPIMTAHIVSRSPAQEVLLKVTEFLQKEFGIFHSTIQIE